jgi:hypothetical protein
MRAKLIVEFEMIAFLEKVDIVIGQKAYSMENRFLLFQLPRFHEPSTGLLSQYSIFGCFSLQIRTRVKRRAARKNGKRTDLKGHQNKRVGIQIAVDRVNLFPAPGGKGDGQGAVFVAAAQASGAGETLRPKAAADNGQDGRRKFVGIEPHDLDREGAGEPECCFPCLHGNSSLQRAYRSF